MIWQAPVGEYDDYSWVGQTRGPGGADVFCESSARDPLFFRNSQQQIRSFFTICTNRIGLFFELPARDPIIF